MYQKIVKPFLDFSIAFVAFVAVFPLFFVVVIGLFFANRGSVFFLQKRPGKNGKLFTIIKFKTMNDSKDSNGVTLPDAKRLTPIGKWIRKTSIDELPQLLNVVKGDMSLVGPRPLLPEYLPLYTSFQNKRHDVKPGITGWAQVNGRNAIDWETKFSYDVWYVANQSFELDLKILLATIVKVIQVENINAANAATMEAFDGK
ncbi:sugar transferase [Flavobacterium restrictum]|uniref:Sugar transferase n=1 Tax=Flavobacterium restrictum TaxID=2594428 RepID=A0A553DW89_9FLAO|nr:sugar transferase [Flavobacterium restrictum]TRX37054.1 sugar transferase [Flavobacterium restrictum]